jgi:phosphoribosylanthranilate isomerase
MFPDPRHFGVKVCGVTQPAQARKIAALGADALGINFWPGSKRHVPLEEAAPWLRDLRGDTVLVGVLVNAEKSLLERLIEEALVHVLQLHGDESPAQVAELMERDVPVIKALQVRNRESLRQIAEYPTDKILLDAYNPGAYGGGGVTFPWELAVIAQEEYPDKCIVLSGGLTAANVRQAVQETRVRAVDVASGVESAPGIKDLELVRQFIEEARAAT